MADSVLVAMDDSPLSREALSFALETFPDAQTTVVHVAHPDLEMLPEDTEEVFGASLDELDGVGDETAASVFQAVREVAGDRDVTATFLTGEAERRIVAYADDSGFDHVVLGTHGRSGISRVLIGSVAEAVLRETAVPTTLVK
ncbi:universal stress protein [Halorubrum lipolyticum]|uniref:UspA domain-containing protein n=1 Tax=Halorubrum lipolyticum DSM 21995 TaxID=1227482 RepID=M0P2G7_9EURY|nr:universal stress protein [Halorubrum lipolyticum]EMA63734.1 UspA domain-containing protein [Halorubrum lipolyticum DSM 21995]